MRENGASVGTCLCPWSLGARAEPVLGGSHSRQSPLRAFPPGVFASTLRKSEARPPCFQGSQGVTVKRTQASLLQWERSEPASLQKTPNTPNQRGLTVGAVPAVGLSRTLLYFGLFVLEIPSETVNVVFV